MQKTALMRDVESREERGKIENWLPAMVEELGLTETARQLRINKATVKNWILEMGFRTERRVVPVAGGNPGDIVEEN